MTQRTDEFALMLPITEMARQTAQRFASQQPTPHKAEQVRQNTLAVLVVNDYLHLMEIPTNLSSGDSWNALLRVCADVADLELPGVGKLECRPVKPQAETCFVPPETWEERVGYVVVQVDESAQEAQLLGFVPSAKVEELPLSTLRSPEDLLDHLDSLRHTIQSRLTDLGQWLQGTIDTGWQTVEAVLNPAQMVSAYAFRTRSMAIRQAKRIELGNDRPAVALVVDVDSVTEAQVEIRLQIHPIAAPALPNGLEIKVLTATGEVAIEAEATGSEDFLELEIDGTAGERFSVQVCLDQTQVIESFII